MRKLFLALVLILPTTFVVNSAEANQRQSCAGHIVVNGNTVSYQGTGDCLLVAYKYKNGTAPGASFNDTLPQVYQWESTQSGPLPDCAYQLDLVQGNAKVAKPTLDVPMWYSGQGALVDSLHGGSVACTTPTTTILPAGISNSVAREESGPESPPAIAVPRTPVFTG